jgi:hypothetical protein
MIMTYWWVMIFLIIALGHFSPGRYPASYLPFVVALVIPVLLSLLSNRLEQRYAYWHNAGFWKKYFLLNGGYALNVGLIMAVTLGLDYLHLLGYFGGDPEGSFGMLYLPSVVGYLVLGLIFALIRRAWKAWPPVGA